MEATHLSSVANGMAFSSTSSSSHCGFSFFSRPSKLTFSQSLGHLLLESSTCTSSSVSVSSSSPWFHRPVNCSLFEGLNGGSPSSSSSPSPSPSPSSSSSSPPSSSFSGGQLYTSIPSSFPPPSPLPPCAIASREGTSVPDVDSWTEKSQSTVETFKNPRFQPLTELKIRSKTGKESEELLKMAPQALQYEAGVLGATPKRDSGIDLKRQESKTSLEYLRAILTSQVYDVAIESPLEKAVKLSGKMNNNIFLKREDMQQVFSFKLRGAYNMMAKLSQDQLKKGVICSSAGNHAQGVALAASRLGCSAVIAMPVTTPDIKWRSVERLGAEVVLVGDAYDETQTYAKKRALEEGRIFIPPFDHPDIISGQGTVGMEILRQHPGPLHAVFVPVGGGGLIAGIAAYIKSLRPEVLVIGVEPVDANAMALSLHHGQRVQLEHVGGFADGVAVKVVGEETFRLCRELVDGVVLVNRDAICAAIKDVFEEVRSILEPAGALSLAGAKAYCQYYGLENESVVAVTSGANMNFDRLRLVTELADVGARREAVLATSMPEKPGSFKTFCEQVGTTNITEFKYRYSDESTAYVLYSVGLHRDEELKALVARMEDAEFPTFDMTGNDLAKDHLRHLVGGRTKVPNEIIYRFVFPERPGALLKFLDMLSPRWNITLFHYRRQGEMGANILVGLQVLPEEEEEFCQSADSLGYEYKDERNNQAFLMFVR